MLRLRRAADGGSSRAPRRAQLAKQRLHIRRRVALSLAVAVVGMGVSATVILVDRLGSSRAAGPQVAARGATARLGATDGRDVPASPAGSPSANRLVDCQLPANAIIGGKPGIQHGFLDMRSGRFSVDPAASDLPGDAYAATFAAQSRRWYPVPAAWIAPDGARWATLARSATAATVSIASRAGTKVIWSGSPFATLIGWIPDGILLQGSIEPTYVVIDPASGRQTPWVFPSSIGTLSLVPSPSGLWRMGSSPGKKQLRLEHLDRHGQVQAWVLPVLAGEARAYSILGFQSGGAAVLGQVGAGGGLVRLLATTSAGSMQTLLSRVDLPAIASVWEWPGRGMVLIGKGAPDSWLLVEGTSTVLRLGPFTQLQSLSGAGPCRPH